LKHGWGVGYIKRLEGYWQEFLTTNFCSLEVGRDELTGGHSIRVASLNKLPNEFILTLGDAIHNLKSALDYLINEITGRKSSKIVFPMAEQKKDLEAYFAAGTKEPCGLCGKGGNKGTLADMETAFPGIGKFIIDEIRPYRDAKELLWHLNKLDVRDKHRMLVPIVSPQALHGIEIVDGNNNKIFGSAEILPDGYVNLAMLVGTGAVKVIKAGNATANVFFNEPGILERQPLFPIIAQMANSVHGTIEGFQTFIADTGRTLS
jgi:hypothetical protein